MQRRDEPVGRLPQGAVASQLGAGSASAGAADSNAPSSSASAADATGRVLTTAATDPANPAHSAADADTTIDRIVWWSFQAAGFLFCVALLSAIGALFLGGAEHRVRQWGWVAGAVIAAVGYPLGWVTFADANLRRRSAEEREQSAQEMKQGMRPLSGALVGGSLGVILGILVYFVLVTFWVSAALSPLAPEEWREGFRTASLSIRLPIRPALILLAWTLGTLAVAGAIFGACGKVYGHSTEAPSGLRTQHRQRGQRGLHGHRGEHGQRGLHRRRGSHDQRRPIADDPSSGRGTIQSDTS